MLKTKSIIYLLFVFLFSNVAQYGFGYGAKVIYAIALTLILLCLRNRLFYGILIMTLAVMSSAYYPVAILDGSPDEHIVLSAMYTNADEVSGYLRTIPAKILALSLLPLCIGVICLVCRLTRSCSLVLPRKVMVIPLIIIMGGPVVTYIKKDDTRTTLVNFPPIRFITTTYSLVDAIIAEDKFYQKQKNMPADFYPTLTNESVDTVMVVIGESMRRDRMSLYGFEQPTTPYMDSRPGTVFTNYISAAPVTPISLAHSLFKLNQKSEKFRIALVKEGTVEKLGEMPTYEETHFDEDGRVEYNNSVVKLFKAAGYETYWLSNQESRGKFDAPAAVLANQADHLFFARYGVIDGGTNKGKPLDSALTPEVLKTISMPEKKVIFVHVFGSHPHPCDRTEGKYDVFYHSENVSCYLQSIKNTDAQIHTFETKLRETGRTWALVYFSDHGLMTEEYGTSNEFYHHSDKRKSNYDVPLFITTSEDTEQRRDDRALSGFDLLSLIAQTAHISDPTLSAICQSVETCPTDRKVISNTGKYIHYNDLPSSY